MLLAPPLEPPAVELAPAPPLPLFAPPMAGPLPAVPATPGLPELPPEIATDGLLDEHAIPTRASHANPDGDGNWLAARGRMVIP